MAQTHQMLGGKYSTRWDGLAGDSAGSYAESLSYSPVAACLRQGQDGKGWQGTGPVHTQNPCHSHLWLLGGWDRMGRVGRGQDQFIGIIPVRGRSARH